MFDRPIVLALVSALAVPVLCATVISTRLAAQDASDFALRVYDASGYEGDVVTTHVHFANTGIHGVQGWQFGVSYPSANLELVRAECGAATLTAKRGAPVDFCAIQHRAIEGGVTMGVVVDTTSGATLPPGAGYDVLALDFRLIRCAESAAEPATTSTLRFSDSLGEPPIAAVVTSELRSWTPAVRIAGTLRCKPPPPCGQEQFPATAGFDSMETVASSFRFSLFGLGTFELGDEGLAGPTVVYRGPREVRDGEAFVRTGIAELDLTGALENGWRVHVTLNSDRPSTGFVRPRRAGQVHDFPASSEFEVYFQVAVFRAPDAETPDLVLFNKTPKRQRNVVCALPPVEQLEPYEPPAAIDLFDAAHPDGPPVGQLLGAHNPEYVPPPDERPAVFVRGDCNADGRHDVSDAISALDALFLGGAVTCLAACDANGDACDGNARVDISDPVYLLSWLFLGGPQPPAPFPLCGTDPCARAANLGCASFPPDACFGHESRDP